MKKVGIIIMTLVLTFCFTACGGGGGDTEEPKDDALKLEKLAAYNAKTGIHTKYEMDYKGQKVTTESYCKGDKLYTKTVVEGTGEQIVIMNGDYMYSLDVNTKTGTKSAAPASAQQILEKSNNGSAENFEKYKDSITVGETEVDGTAYYSESYVSEEEGNEGTITYCFDGDTLTYMIAESDGEKVTLKYLAYDGDVDESVFEVPDGYKITEM